MGVLGLKGGWGACVCVACGCVHVGNVGVDRDVQAGQGTGLLFTIHVHHTAAASLLEWGAWGGREQRKNGAQLLI